MSLTDYQWIILWETEDHPASVWRRDETWFLRERNVTLQIKALLQRGLIELTAAHDINLVRVTEKGEEALAQRDYMAVLNRWNAR